MLTYEFKAPSGHTSTLIEGFKMQGEKTKLVYRAGRNQRDIGYLYKTESGGYSFVVWKDTGILRFNPVYGLDYPTFSDAFIAAGKTVEIALTRALDKQ